MEAIEAKMSRSKLAFLIAAVVLLGACDAKIPTFDLAGANRDIAHIRTLAQRADVIFVGTVTAVGQRPSATSGRVGYEQVVTYDVESVLKGFFGDSTIVVEHLVVANSRHASGGGLDPAIFSPGKRLIVLVRRVEYFLFEDVNENWGTIPHSSRNEKALIFAM